LGLYESWFELIEPTFGSFETFGTLNAAIVAILFRDGEVCRLKKLDEASNDLVAARGDSKESGQVLDANNEFAQEVGLKNLVDRISTYSPIRHPQQTTTYL